MQRRLGMMFRATAPLAALALLLGVWLAGAAAVQAAGETRVTWFGQAAFKVETPAGGVILIDPWLTNPKNPDEQAIDKLGRVDYILVTHAHGDHVGNSVQIAKATGAELVTSAGLRRNLVAAAGYPAKQATAATSGNVGGSIPLPKAGARVTLVNAVHGSELTLSDPLPGGTAAVVGGNPVGMVLEVEGGPTFYHTGDTDVFTDMKLIPEFFRVDVMLAAIGDHYTMGPERAALAVEFVQPRRVMPMHYGTFPLLRGNPADFRAALDARDLAGRLVVMKPGDTRTF